MVRDLMVGLKPNEDLRLYKELKALAVYICTIKTEIATIRPDEIRDHYLPTATDELDAIVEATEHATHTILAAALGND